MSSFGKKIKNYFINTDKFLWLMTIAALIFSIVLINSLQRSTEYNFLNTQIIAVIIGFVLAIVLSIINYKYLLQIWWLFAGLSIILLMLVFIFGKRVNGADDVAWIYIGPVSIQPSEFIKVFFIITFSKHLQVLNESGKIKTLLGVLSLIIHAAIPSLLIHFQGEDGTVLVFIFMFILMAFLGGVQLRYFFIMLIVLAAAIPLAWNFVLSDEHKNRFLAIFDLEGSALKEYGWQQYQGKVSIASGALEGSGLGNGQRVESYIVPEQENDFIFTVAGEELGFIGCIVLLAILLCIIIKILVTTIQAKDYSGKMICAGVFSMLATQTVINIGMVLGLLPVIGITLPFFSSGGTSIIASLMSIGIVQSVYLHKDDVEESAGLLKDKKYKYIPNKNNMY